MWPFLAVQGAMASSVMRALRMTYSKQSTPFLSGSVEVTLRHPTLNHPNMSNLENAMAKCKTQHFTTFHNHLVTTFCHVAVPTRPRLECWPPPDMLTPDVGQRLICAH